MRSRETIRKTAVIDEMKQKTPEKIRRAKSWSLERTIELAKKTTEQTETTRDCTKRSCDHIFKRPGSNEYLNATKFSSFS